MLLSPFSALAAPFPRILVVKGNANNGRSLHFCPFSILVTPLLDVASISLEATGCIGEAAIDDTNETAINAVIAPGNSPFCFFISCFTVSLASSINRPELYSDFTILIIASISSFEMNKVNPFPAPTARRSLIFLSKLSITDEATLVANFGKTYLVKGTTMIIRAFLGKLPIILANVLPKIPPDRLFHTTELY